MTTRFRKALEASFDRLYSNLNTEQKAAVQAVTGPLLVIAGAGSGKTTVLVHRIANIIRFGRLSEFAEPYSGGSDEDAALLEKAFEGSNDDLAEALSDFAVDPCPAWAVMCITFTNKAANEMKARLEKTLGAEAASEIWAGTFHSICMRLLRRFNENAGLAKGFTIYDTDDTKRLLNAIVKDLDINEHILTAKSAANIISRAKESLISCVEFAVQNNSDLRLRKAAEVYTEYQRRLAEASAVDFDDIIVKTVELLKHDEEVRDYVQRRFRYVCVDEYQDTNHAQFVLTSLFAGGRRNLMVVGDDDQSIYRFRGATIENILNFDENFKDARVIKLERNYRSTAKILDAANAVIANNKGRRGKKLWTENGEGKNVLIKQLQNQNSEARYIADEIMKGVRDEGRSFSDYAILYRMNAQSSSLEGVFSKSGISYRILGGTRFYDRKEIKDIVAYLCVVANPGDTLRLKRIINEPKRKIGDATIEAIEKLANAEGTSMYDIILRANEYTALARSATKLIEFARLIESFRDQANEGALTSELVRYVIEKSGYRAMLEAAGIAEIDRLKNIEELVSNAVEYEKDNDEASLYGFLEDIALVSDIDNYDENADAVVMMTIHSAKGLEFPYVFLPGMEEGMFPSVQSMNEEAELEEERRLAYVAITRAEKELCCTYVRERLLYGKTQYNRLSRFAGEIPEDYCTHEKIERPVQPAISIAQQRRTENIARFRENVSSAAPAVKRDTAFTRFNAGDEVIHATFGRGNILSVRDMGSDVLYEIVFDKVGTKKMMATYAKLKKPE